MKKLFISLFSFILILTGGILSSNSFSSYANDEVIQLDVFDGEDLVTYLTQESTYLNKNVKIKLHNPIDLTEIDLSPISNFNGNFMGTFDGDGYSISNISLTSNSHYFGLIPYATDATIQNIKISGNINYIFDENNSKEIYVGVLVGYGENVVFRNCEFDAPQDGNKITLPIYSDFNFGMLAGKLKGNPLANSSGNRANIRDCVNYYNLDVQLNKQSNIYVGGFVGSLQNAYMLNVLNQGKITFTNSLVNGGNADNTNKHYLGGMVGSLSGTGTHIRNSVFGGNMEISSVVTSLKLKKGAIFGGVLSNVTSVENINFDYYVDSNLNICGDGYVSEGDKIKRVEIINKAFLTNTENFDEQSQNTPFDFNNVWTLSESRFHLQCFLSFNFTIKSVLNNTIDFAKIYSDEEEKYFETFTARYNEKVRIDLILEEEFVGYYKLSGLTLSNLDFDMKNAEVIPFVNDKGQEYSYIILIYANAMTSGSYGFDIQSITYNCVATISEEAKTLNQGGVRIADNNITTPTDEMSIQFTYNSAVKKIVAEGEKGSVYAFDCWKLYYKEDSGEYSTNEITFANSTDSTLSIAFGSAPFDREFKLVAYFTDENAIMVSFGELNSKHIKSIKFSGVDYDGSPIAVSPNYAKNLEIVTAKNYKLNVKSFEDIIKKLYGDNSIETLIIADPEVSQTGETTYKFSVNMRYIESIKDNNLLISLQVDEDDSNSNNNMLWLWIVIAVVGVILIGIIVFIIVRHARGGGKGGKVGKTTKTKVKKESYKDYF